MASPAKIHPYNDIATIPPKTEVIIMGTCPPDESEGDLFKWYYGSRYNYLWNKILIHSSGRPFLLLDDAQQFLRNKNAWMFDICKRYGRVVPGSALDHHLKDIEKEKLSDLFHACSHLTKIILTGTKTELLFRQAIEGEGLLERYKFNDGMKAQKLSRERQITLLPPFSREIMVTTVASPSRRNGNANCSLGQFKAALPNWFIQLSL